MKATNAKSHVLLEMRRILAVYAKAPPYRIVYCIIVYVFTCQVGLRAAGV